MASKYKANSDAISTLKSFIRKNINNNELVDEVIQNINSVTRKKSKFEDRDLARIVNILIDMNIFRLVDEESLEDNDQKPLDLSTLNKLLTETNIRVNPVNDTFEITQITGVFDF